MAGDVELDIDVLRNRLDRLLSLHENVTTLAGALRDLRFRQTGAAWSTAPAVGAFLTEYKRHLNGYGETLQQVSKHITEYKDALVASATALQLQDEAVQERLRQLTERLDLPMAPPAPVCTPENPTGASTSTPAPSPAPQPAAAQGGSSW